MNADQTDRFQGCLLGLATGDALGTALEFQRPGTFQPIVDMIGGGPFNLEPGQWTDDTSMGPLPGLEFGGVQRIRSPRPDRAVLPLGNTVRAALDHYRTTGDPCSGSLSTATAGNGSIMRLAPVAMCGQVAGAYYGASAIPSRWLDRLSQEAFIRELAGRLHSH